jgi:hypothetical protein
MIWNEKRKDLAAVAFGAAIAGVIGLAAGWAAFGVVLVAEILLWVGFQILLRRNRLAAPSTAKR